MHRNDINDNVLAEPWYGVEQLELIRTFSGNKNTDIKVEVEVFRNPSSRRDSSHLLTDGKREEEKGEIFSLKQKRHGLAEQHLTLLSFSFLRFWAQ